MKPTTTTTTTCQTSTTHNDEPSNPPASFAAGQVERRVAVQVCEGGVAARRDQRTGSPYVPRERREVQRPVGTSGGGGGGSGAGAGRGAVVVAKNALKHLGAATKPHIRSTP